MAWQAGQIITAARLTNRLDGVNLTDTAPTTAWTDWGTETVTWPNPGVEVTVTASLVGRWLNAVDTTAVSSSRVRISLDGGTTWSYGQIIYVQTGTGAGAQIRAVAASQHAVTGTPTGSVIVKARCMTEGSATATLGSLNAHMVAT